MKLTSKVAVANKVSAQWCPCQGSCGFTCAKACTGCSGTCADTCIGSLFGYPGM